MTKDLRTIVFPRWSEDVATERRVLVHVPSDQSWFAVGDSLVLVPSRHSFGKAATVVEVTRGQLVELLADDLPLLNLGPGDVAAYSARWDRANPRHPIASDPTVWRVVFRYDPSPRDGDPPEWSLAS
jgi:hypothetical protein